MKMARIPTMKAAKMKATGMAKPVRTPAVGVKKKVGSMLMNKLGVGMNAVKTKMSNPSVVAKVKARVKGVRSR